MGHPTTYREPSILWMIERAPTLEMLIEIMQKAVTCKDASKETRNKWHDACERRMFILERNPPTFEKIGVAEAFGDEALKDPRLKMTPEEVIRQVLDMRHFKCVEDGVFEFIGEGDVPKPIADYFNSLDGNQGNQTHPLAEGETARAFIPRPGTKLIITDAVGVNVRSKEVCPHDTNGDGDCHLCVKTGCPLKKPRCPGCDGMGYIVKHGHPFDPPDQEPCPVCGP